jgi:Casein Kinase 2 substrate
MEEARDYIVKAVSVIQSHIFKWNEVTVRCRTILKELLSQVEQLECIRKSKPCLLTNAFPDLKERLQQMVQMTIDENLIALQIAW